MLCSFDLQLSLGPLIFSLGCSQFALGLKDVYPASSFDGGFFGSREGDSCQAVIELNDELAFAYLLVLLSEDLAYGSFLTGAQERVLSGGNVSVAAGIALDLQAQAQGQGSEDYHGDQGQYETSSFASRSAFWLLVFGHNVE
jgi:hypothetical protein